MAGIFISYRRDDSQGFAGRLSDDLTEILGGDLVFRDIEIPVGQDFTKMLNHAVAACDVLLVVIGRNWQIPVTPGEKSRLFAAEDWVRAEIEAAFEHNKQVIPVLVAGATMSPASELPESIARLAKIQAFVMSDRHWDNDIQSLVQLLRKYLPAFKAKTEQKDAEPGFSTTRLLRHLGNRYIDKLVQRNAEKPKPGSLLFSLFSSAVKKILTMAVVLGLIYAALRLFGDADVLRKLDQLEATLQTGWGRLQQYIGSI